MTLEQLLAAADESADELLVLYRNLISFPTINTGVMPTGHETPCAEFVRGELERDGVMDAAVLEAAPGRGNLVARRPGRGGGRALLLMSHLDVVPPGDESRWTYPPFEPAVIDGWVYGRGSNDCKGLAAAEIQAMRLLSRHRVELDGDVLLACGADEEAGGKYGFGYLAEHHPEWLRADLGVNEGGGSPARLADGRPAWLVGIGEKGRYEATVTIGGRSEHASVPWLADNPLNRLAEVIRALVAYQPEVSVSGPAVGVLPRLWGVPVPPPSQFDELLQQRWGERPQEASRFKALSRMTWVPTVVRAGGKSNAVPDQAVLSVDVRTLPHQDADYVRRELNRALSGMDQVQSEVTTTAEPNQSAWTPAIERALAASLAAIGIERPELLPTLCTGFTDSRLVRPLGVPVLGFAPVPAETDLSRCGCHNIDEQFPFDAVLFRTKQLLALAWHFCGA